MRLVLVVALSLAALAFSAPNASGAGCIYGSDPQACVVSVQTVVCVTEPCDGVIVCVGRGLVCTNDLLP